MIIGLEIHESSPSGATFQIFKAKCINYTSSYFYENKKLGADLDDGGTNENLEELSFRDESFDIFISQDVMEHVNNPSKAFKEIARVLKQGGTCFYCSNISFSCFKS